MAPVVVFGSTDLCFYRVPAHFSGENVPFLLSGARKSEEKNMLFSHRFCRLSRHSLKARPRTVNRARYQDLRLYF